MDDELRRRVRAAQAAPDAASLLALAGEQARAGAWDAAASAALRALARGAPADPGWLSDWGPSGLEDFVPRQLGARFGLGRLAALCWTGDGSALAGLSGSDGREVVLFERLTGRTRRLGELPARRPSPRRGRALAFDPEQGRLLLAASNEAQSGVELSWLAEDGTLQPAPFPAARDTFLELYPSLRLGQVFLASHKTLRAYPSPGGKALWDLRGDAAAVCPWGAVVLRDGMVHLHALGERRPRASVPLLEVCPERWHGPGWPVWPEAAAVAGGAVLLYRGGRNHLLPSNQDVRVGPASEALARLGLLRHLLPPHQAVRVGPTGEVLARLALPLTGGYYTWAVCPLGRHLALLPQVEDPTSQVLRRAEVLLVDLAHGVSRKLPLPALPRSLAWSPSGRALAIGTDEGTITLLEAGAPPGALPPPRAESDWVELVHGDRFWRARVRGAALELHWGLRGAQGQRKTIELEDEAEAARQLARRRAASERKGYRPGP